MAELPVELLTFLSDLDSLHLRHIITVIVIVVFVILLVGGVILRKIFEKVAGVAND